MEEKKLIAETQITVRRVQTGVMVIFTNTSGKDIIYHYPDLTEESTDILKYMTELMYPEVYAEKVKAEEDQKVEVRVENKEVGEPPVGTGKEPEVEPVEDGGGVHLP